MCVSTRTLLNCIDWDNNNDDNHGIFLNQLQLVTIGTYGAASISEVLGEEQATVSPG